MRTRLNNLFAGVAVLAAGSFMGGPALAQSAGPAAEQQAIQDEITQGINSGTLSADQIAALQSRLQQSNTAGSTGASNANSEAAASLARQAGLGTVGVGAGETPTALPGIPSRAGTTTAPTTTQLPTGPDPFTYNTLGPDAYAAQKYANPAYTVPAYPTTNPQPQGSEQQYSAPSAGSPYGAGYAQAPGAGQAGSQVYVYHPSSMSR